VAIIDSLIIDEAVASALRSADFGEYLHACAFRMLSAFEGETWAEVVLILDRDQWDATAGEACHEARAIASRALDSVGVSAILICRTRSQHERFAAQELGIWTAVNPSVSCG
jgi:hypothetical protein